MLTEKDYCDYELIVELEQSGMPIKIDFACSIENGQLVKTKFYPDPPLLYEAQKWLREKHNLHIEITYSPACWTGKIYDLKKWDYIKGFTFIESYEEALSEGIKEAVKLLEEE